MLSMNILLEAMKCYPYLRMGQLLYCASQKAGYEGDIFYIENNQLEKGLRELIRIAYKKEVN